MPAAPYTKMKAITTIARILQIVNDTNYTVTPNGSYSPTATQAPSLSSTTFSSYTPTQTFNMTAYYSATVSPMPSQSQSLSSSPSLTATPTQKITYQVVQSSSPFYALTPEQWAYILVPCICFAVITCWCNVKLWSRVEDLDHELKQYQSQRIHNPAYHSSIRNVLPLGPLTSNTAFSHV